MTRKYPKSPKDFADAQMNKESRKSGVRAGLAVNRWMQRHAASWLPVFLISFGSSGAFAGDAVAIGYNADGVWTAVTYYASSTPKGGKDYKIENGAREEAMRDLRRRSAYAAKTVTILSSSDSTGFVAVGRGTDKSGKDVNVVGRGKSQISADQQVFDKLGTARATKDQKIAYRYFSYGSDSK